MEGALKLKEISYIHAEGYAAGEMKHGPIALIDPAVPVIAIAPSGPLFEKTASNLQEAAARGGQVIVFSDAAGAAKLKGIAAETVVLPAVDPFVAPILYAIPVQLLAYHVAVLKGTDVDQPRNLAKSRDGGIAAPPPGGGAVWCCVLGRDQRSRPFPIRATTLRGSIPASGPGGRRAGPCKSLLGHRSVGPMVERTHGRLAEGSAADVASALAGLAPR